MDEPPAASTAPRALALCAFAYLYVFPYQAQLNNPNENVRFYMTAAIVERDVRDRHAACALGLGQRRGACTAATCTA